MAQNKTIIFLIIFTVYFDDIVNEFAVEKSCSIAKNLYVLNMVIRKKQNKIKKGHL